jgi:hypothetical protein
MRVPHAAKRLTDATRGTRAAGNAACGSAPAGPAAAHRDHSKNKEEALMQHLKRPDRYLSFVGIEGDKNSRELMVMLRRHIDDPHKTNRFWELFKDKLERVGKPDENSGRCLDELFLIHAYINNISELFEQYDDQPALALLEQIETESC